MSVCRPDKMLPLGLGPGLVLLLGATMGHRYPTATWKCPFFCRVPVSTEAMKMRVYPHDRSSKYPGNIRLLCSIFESTQDIHYINVLSLDWLGLVACAISGPRAKVICSSHLGRDYRNAGFWKSKSSDTMLKWQHQKLADCTWLHHIDPYCTIVFLLLQVSACACVCSICHWKILEATNQF